VELRFLTYETETDRPQTYDPFLEYHDTFPDLGKDPESNQIFGGRPGGLPVVNNNKKRKYEEGLTNIDSNSQVPTDIPEGIDVVSDGYYGYKDKNNGSPTQNEGINPTSVLGFKVQQTDAPKTVTYANEWQTPSSEQSSLNTLIARPTLPNVPPPYRPTGNYPYHEVQYDENGYPVININNGGNSYQNENNGYGEKNNGQKDSTSGNRNPSLFHEIPVERGEHTVKNENKIHIVDGKPTQPTLFHQIPVDNSNGYQDSNGFRVQTDSNGYPINSNVYQVDSNGYPTSLDGFSDDSNEHLDDSNGYPDSSGVYFDPTSGYPSGASGYTDNSNGQTDSSSQPQDPISPTDPYPSESLPTGGTTEEKYQQNENDFSPTAGTITRDPDSEYGSSIEIKVGKTGFSTGNKDASSGRDGIGKAEINLSGFFEGTSEEVTPHVPTPKKKYTNTRIRNTYSTREKGKPTFIGFDRTSTYRTRIDKKEDTTAGTSVIVTKPIENSSEVTLINPLKTRTASTSISSSVRSGGSSSGSSEGSEGEVRISGIPFLKSKEELFGTTNNNRKQEEASQNEVINNNPGAAIVEQVPANVLSAEDVDPQTKCQAICGNNEICQIKQEGIQCKCRPGFGKRTNLPNAICEKSRTYQIEVLTHSESQETRIVRFNPRAVQKAVENSFKNRDLDIFHGAEVTSIKASNNTKRNFILDNEEFQEDNQGDMAIQLLVQVSDDGDDGPLEEERIRSLIEPTIKETKFPLGADIMVSRVSIDDFDECLSYEYNDCSDHAVCQNMKGTYTCSCKEGYLDFSGSSASLTGRVCSAQSTESCRLCSGNGQCSIKEGREEVECKCQPWFAGQKCQINLKLLLIVGAVSVCLMMMIACGVSCFCCRDRRKKHIPTPYGVSMARIPPNVRQQSLMMDPHGTVKSAMSARGRQKQKRPAPRQPLQKRSSNQSLDSSRQWQSNLGGSTPPHGHAMSKPALVIPRAKFHHQPSSHTNYGYHSDEDLSSTPVERNRAVSEVASMASRHRRKSVPSSFAGLLGGGRNREGSVDPLLEGFQSDGGDSGGRNSSSTFHESRADTRSEARSYNETIIRPVTRRLQSAQGTSYRSSRSNRTSEDGGTMAHRDTGSSFVVSPRQQLYRLHDSDGSLDSM